MTSYFKSLFGGGDKSKSRSHSSANIYAPPSKTRAPAPPPLLNPQRSQSFSASRSAGGNPSPLRFATGTDTRTTYGYGKRSPSYSSQTPSERPTVLRRSSYKLHEGGHHIYTPTSSRTNSTSSVYTHGGSRPPLTSSGSDHGHYHSKLSPSRPPLRSNHTWHPGSVAGSASSLGSSQSHRQEALTPHARPTSLHMHPVLAYTRLHRAPITYDVSYTPSARTVLDRATLSAIPSHTLAQPATDPPTPTSARLILRSEKLPWPVVVGSSGPRFTIGPGRVSDAKAISVLDVLYAVHTTLLTPVTPEEWESLGHGSRAQQKVTKAYEKRCSRMGGGWEGGVRRIDWLGEKTRLVGVEVDKSAGRSVGKLIFSKA